MSPATPKKLSVEDRLDIQELFARYAWALDLGDPDGVVATFTEDGVLNHLWQGELRGHDAIRAALQELWYDRPSWWPGRQHLANHFLIEADGENAARVRAFFSILQYNVYYRTNFVFGVGTWDNRCVRSDDGVWRFSYVRINAWTDVSQIPWQGDARAWSVNGAAAQPAGTPVMAQPPS
jgi:SnoaL-like domain